MKQTSVFNGLSRLFIVFGTVVAASLAHGQGAVPGEYLMKMKDSAVGSIHAKLAGKAFLKAAFSKGSYHVMTNDKALVDSLKADPEVEYIEPNYLLQSIEPEVHQQNLDALVAKNYDQTGATVHANEAWAAASPYSASNRPIVAIVDTGLDRSHYVFANTGALWTNTAEIPGNGIDDDFNGYVDDVNGWNFITNSNNFFDDEDHGTHVAGIVLGATQDILAPSLEPAKIRIMPLKFLDSTGAGSTAAAINAIYYAVNNGAKVINCSWGGGTYSHALHDALTNAYNHGVLVVSAAGNYASNNDSTPLYPASYNVPSNIAVAATTDSDRLATFSNFGVSTVQVASPGVYVYSTMPGNYFASLSGTSMAAPFVAGAAAMALREAPQVSGFQLRSLIMSTSTHSGYLTGKVASGGRIDEAALMSGAAGMVSVAAYQPSYTPDYSADRSPASETKAGGGCGLVRAVTQDGGAGPGSPGASGALAVLFGLPCLLWFALRRQAPSPHRRFERYVMRSEVVIRSGDRELVGQLNTISLGGLSFNVDEALEKGGAVSMKIAGPSGGEPVEVEGHIVWSERNGAYGVQFGDVKSSVQETLFGWTRNLVRQGMRS